MFSLLTHDITQDLMKGQKCGGMGYMSDICFLVIVFVPFALGRWRMSGFSVDLTFFLLLHQLREFQFQAERS